MNLLIVALAFLAGCLFTGLLLALAFCLMVASSRRELESDQMAPPLIGH